MNEKLHVLGPIRHECTGCGKSCLGVMVYLLPEEKPKIMEIAQDLGIKSPIEGDHLRLEKGRCVFLGNNQLCLIHEKHSYDQKPLVCRQFPLVLVRTGELRAGVDPGCYQSWKLSNAPLLESMPGAVENKIISQEEENLENKLLDFLDDQEITLSMLAAELAGRKPIKNKPFPPGIIRRIVISLREAKLEALWSENTSPALMESLSPLLSKVKELDPANTKAPKLSKSQELFALDVTKRMLFLRLATGVLTPYSVAVLMLIGSLACGWSSSNDESYGFALSAWSRAIRSEPFWKAIAKDQKQLRWIIVGF